MAIDLSPSQLCAMMAGTETTPGVLSTTFNPANQGFLTMTSPNPFQPQFNNQDYVPHQSTWTEQKDIPTTAVQAINFQFPMQGGATATTAPRFEAILEASGLVKGTAGTITTGLVAKASTVQAVGTKAIICTTAASTGACALKTGDIILFSGDTQKYIVITPATQATASTDVTVTINPGKLVALAGGESVTVVPNIPYTPANLSNIVSASVAMQLFGKTNNAIWAALGVYGSSVITGTFDRGLILNGTLQGLFQLPVLNTTLKATYGSGTNEWSGGPNNANKFILAGGNLVRIDNGAGSYVGLIQSMKLDLGVQVVPIFDINSGATFGVFTIQPTRRKPTLEIVLGLDLNPSSLVTFRDFSNDWNTANTYAVYFSYPDLSGRTWAGSIPYAQITQPKTGDDGNNRNVSLMCKIQSSFLDQELTLSHY